MRKSDYLLIASKFFTKKYPFQVTHFVTGRCNAKCKHCFYWKETNQNKNELTLEEIRQVSKSMSRFFSLILTGGEPFLRDDLGDIAKIYYDNNQIGNLQIPSNGFLTDKIYNTTKEILGSCPNMFFSMSLSLDGIGKDHDKSRGVRGIFKNVGNTYRKVAELKKDYNNFDVGFLTAVTTLNEGKLKDMWDYVKEEFNADLMLIKTRGDPRNPVTKEIDLRNYEAIAEFQKDKFENPAKFNQGWLKMMVRKHAYNIRHEYILRTCKENRYLIPCYAGKLEAIIDEEGIVYPCELIDKSMGSLRDFDLDFKKLWNSKQAEDIRRFIKESKCFCTHECAVRTNILFNPKVMLKGKI